MTGDFSFERLLEIGRLLKKSVSVPLVANTRDIDHAEGEALLEAGFVGAYHAVRLGEGRDTPLDPRLRIRTIRVLKDVGLKWMNCIEPVGLEHSAEEIADLMLLAREVLDDTPKNIFKQKNILKGMGLDVPEIQECMV